MKVANNVNGIVFVPVFSIEDANGAALTDKMQFAYNQVPIKDANGKDVLTHVPIHFIPTDKRLMRFRSFRKALRFLRENRSEIKSPVAEIKESRMMVHYNTPTPQPQSIPKPMVEHGCFVSHVPNKYRSTPEMYRRRGMKGHALFMLYGGVNFRALSERMRKNCKASVTGLIPVAKRKRFNEELGKIA